MATWVKLYGLRLGYTGALCISRGRVLSWIVTNFTLKRFVGYCFPPPVSIHDFGEVSSCEVGESTGGLRASVANCGESGVQGVGGR